MTSKQDIEQTLWSINARFRRVIGSSRYQDYVLLTLFMKYFSDVSREKVETSICRNEESVPNTEVATNWKCFMIDNTPVFDFLYANRNDAEIIQKITSVVKHVEEYNNGKLHNIFQILGFYFLQDSRESQRILTTLLEGFNSLDLRPGHLESPDVVGDAYESLLAMFTSAEGKMGGESLTPGQVSELAVALLQPEENDSVYDPVCGCGGTLIKVRKKTPNGKASLFGQELNPRIWALCEMNMILHGVEDACIWQGDIFANPQNIENDALKQFQVVVAHPPYGWRGWQEAVFGKSERDSYENASASLDPYQRFDLGLPPSSNADYAFILHMLASLEPERGRMAVILPHGVLFRGGSEREIRRRLVEMNLIDAIIGLPSNLLYGTSIPVCILVFKKNRSRRDVLFIDASADGNFEKVRTQNILRKSDIARITGVYQKWENVKKYSHIATFKEIEENDFDLNISRYVDIFDEEEQVDIVATQQNIANIEAKLAEVQQELAKRWEELNF